MTPREKFLLALFGGAVFLMFTLGLVLWSLRAHTRAEAKVAEYENLLLDYDVVLQDKALWSELKDWLASHPPAVKTEQSAKTDLVQLVEQTALRHPGIRFTRMQPGEVEPGAALDSITVSLVCEGEEKSVIPFLYELTKAESYRALGFVRLRALPQDKSKVLCEARLTQWFQKGGAES
ncbi:MAG: hypothetical protein AAF555_10965 [Verrucomicrobiota bacterium]